MFQVCNQRAHGLWTQCGESSESTHNFVCVQCTKCDTQNGYYVAPYSHSSTTSEQEAFGVGICKQFLASGTLGPTHACAATCAPSFDAPRSECSRNCLEQVSTEHVLIGRVPFYNYVTMAGQLLLHFWYGSNTHTVYHCKHSCRGVLLHCHLRLGEVHGVVEMHHWNGRAWHLLHYQQARNDNEAGARHACNLPLTVCMRNREAAMTFKTQRVIHKLATRPPGMATPAVQLLVLPFTQIAC